MKKMGLVKDDIVSIAGHWGIFAALSKSIEKITRLWEETNSSVK